MLQPAQRIYAHFPWCEKKCPYCDFNSHTGGFDDTRYADALLAEYDARAHEVQGPLRSIYFGGGTPSLWAPEEVGRVLRRFEALGLADDVEITLEANPGTVVADRFKAYVDQGVNRFSIGVQSFLQNELDLLGRIHDADQAERAIRGAKASGARGSFDLIYGLPGQSRAQAAESIDRALSLEPEHLSAYALTIEPETAFGRRHRLGLFKPMHEDGQAELMLWVGERLAAAGLPRYEISSYAAAGNEARHNASYWLGAAYLGLGAGAHSFIRAADYSASERFAGERHPQRYQDAALSGTPAGQRESYGRLDSLKDRLLTAVRTRLGFVPEALDAEVGAQGALASALEEAFADFSRQGWLQPTKAGWIPTDSGFLFGDTMARRLLDVPDALDFESIAPR